MELILWNGYMDEVRKVECRVKFPARSSAPITDFVVTPGEESLVRECYSGEGCSWGSMHLGRGVTRLDGWHYLDALMHTRNISWAVEVTLRELSTAGLDKDGQLLSTLELGSQGLDPQGDPLEWGDTCGPIRVPRRGKEDSQSQASRGGKLGTALVALRAYRRANVLWWMGGDPECISDPVDHDPHGLWLTACRQLAASMDRLLDQAPKGVVRLEDVDRLRVRAYGLIAIHDNLRCAPTSQTAADGRHRRVH